MNIQKLIIEINSNMKGKFGFINTLGKTIIQGKQNDNYKQVPS